MKNKFLSLTLIAFALLAFSFNGNAQAPFKYLTHIFPSDSLKGFDEAFYNKMALNDGYFGSEYHVFMYSVKRNFINQKYGYTKGPGFNTTAKGGNNTIYGLPCQNEDFEGSPVGLVTGALLGWQLAEGQNIYLSPGGSCTMNGCCPTFPSNNAWVMATPVVGDPVIGTIPASPFGGTKILKMNDDITNKGEVVRIQQTFPVTSSNALFQLAYMAALNGTGHTCCSQPYVRITLIDCMNNLIACPQVSITPPGPSCATVSATGWSTNASGYSYTAGWQIRALDLTPYMGSCVTIQITIGDCDGWAHFGYGYVDCQCLPMTVCVNNICFPAGNAAVAVAACGVTTGTMVAPPGLGPYTWNGPVGSGITNNPNQTVTTTVAGNYTLTMNPIGVCAPITKTVTLTFGTFPTAGFTQVNACTTYSFTNTGTGPPAVQTYSFVGPGPPPSFTTTASTSVVNFAPSTTYTVLQTVTNAAGCPATASMVITTPAGPSPAFTASPSFTQCFTGNAFTFNASTAVGSQTYNFNPTVGAPAPGFTSNYGPVSFTAPGNYTVTHIVVSGGCTVQTQSVCVVNSVPTASASATPPACSGGVATLIGSGGPGSISWAGPGGFTAFGSPVAINNFTVGNQGTYTMTVNNFGCSTTVTVNITMPAVPSVTVTNTGPYCVGQTIQFNAVPSSTNISFSYWYNAPFTWYNFTSALLTPTIANAQTTSSGVYYFYISWSGGCWATASTTVSVVNTPTVSASNTGPYCPGATVQLNCPTAAGSYTWTGPASFTAAVQNPTTTTATNATYSVMIGTGSCTAAAVTNVVINPLPTPTVSSNSPVCLGSAINLSVTAATTYTWTGPSGFTSNAQNPIIASSTAVMAGVYTVTVSNAAGCKATATLNVVITTPTTTAANTGPYCAGQTIQLSTPAATTYTWTGPSAYASNAQNPNIVGSTVAMSGVYTVTSTTGACKATATTNVIVNALPIPNALATTPVCVGQPINLTGTGGTTYTWTGPATFNSNSATPSIGTSSVANAGNYVLTVTDANGCKNSTNINVVVNPLPVIVLNTPVNCVNTTINLTSNGGVTYTWTGPGGFTSNAQNPNIPLAQIPMSGVYVVTVTDANGCINTANTNVSVLPLPNPNIASNSPVCAGGVLTLTGSGGTTYAWSGPGYTGPTQNPVINNVTTAASGVYTLLVGSGTCTASTTYTVLINPLPVFNFANTNVLCNGQSNGTSNVNVTVGSGPYNYSWSTSPVQTTQNATGLFAGTYSCQVTDANGCTSVSSILITQPTAFSVAINSATYSACAGSPINVIANGSGGTGPYSYNWVSGPSSAPYTVNEALSGNYSYTVNATDAFNCPATNLINLTFVPQPTITATSATICAGQTANLIASGATNYVWQPGNVTGNTYPYNGNTSVNVSVIGTSNGCSNSTNASVIINPIPNANISTSPTKGCVPTCLTFTANGSSSIVSYGWTLNGVGITGAQAGTYCFSDAATYSLGLNVMDSYGCASSAPPVIVDMYPQPIADFNHAPIKPIVNIDQEVTFTDASYGAPIVSWNWYFMNTAQYTSTQQNPMFSYTEPGTYVVALVVKSDKGCYDTLLRPLVVGEDFGIYVPNSFTPNADGLNDIFQPKGFGVTKYELNIFDRWGEKVFHTTTFEEGWDGSFQGRGNKICEENSYTWLINCTSVFGKSHELKGHVTLIK